MIGRGRRHLSRAAAAQAGTETTGIGGVLNDGCAPANQRRGGQRRSPQHQRKNNTLQCPHSTVSAPAAWMCNGRHSRNNLTGHIHRRPARMVGLARLHLVFTFLARLPGGQVYVSCPPTARFSIICRPSKSQHRGPPTAASAPDMERCRKPGWSRKKRPSVDERGSCRPCPARSGAAVVEQHFPQSGTSTRNLIAEHDDSPFL